MCVSTYTQCFIGFVFLSVSNSIIVANIEEIYDILSFYKIKNVFMEFQILFFFTFTPYFLNETFDMEEELTRNKAEYVIIFINEFAQKFNLTSVQAYRYLSQFKAIDFLISQYNIAHTQGFNTMVSDMAAFCRRQGGAIV